LNDFPFSWEWNNHPNWRTPFFRGVGSTTNQETICLFKKKTLILVESSGIEQMTSPTLPESLWWEIHMKLVGFKDTSIFTW
jgi:hypothetical protein